VLFTNDPKLISKTYQRYLLNKFRDELSFNEVPIKLYLRRRHPADLRDDVGARSDSATKQQGEPRPERQRATPADA
jgi:hypothetical protein